MEQLLALVENALKSCFESGYPQQVEADTSFGRIVILVGLSKLDESDGEKYESANATFKTKTL